MPLRRLRMTEAHLTEVLVEAGMLYGWQVTHFRPAKTERGWRTPLQGHSGFPDLVLARDGIILVAELKIGSKKPRPDQQKWATAIGPVHYRLWTDRNLPEALAELRAPRTSGIGLSDATNKEEQP